MNNDVSKVNGSVLKICVGSINRKTQSRVAFAALFFLYKIWGEFYVNYSKGFVKAGAFSKNY